MIASDFMDFGQELHPSGKNISTYLDLFPSLKEVKIICPRLFSEQTVHEVLTDYRPLRRLCIISHENSKIDYTPFPKHGTLELLFLELNGLSVDDGCNRLLNETLSNLFSPKYILRKIEHGKYPSIKHLNAFFEIRPELQWLVVVFNEYGKVMLCHADKHSRTGVEIIKDPTFHLGNLIHTYPELYDIFWNEFQKLSKCSLY
ncbi:unnamed protein product [Dibothriocephalus latus]|uniref:Uncharacterized protein n=1 Tax=Dibothriocephalus latus TaxID=60516 RepID=A0A3P6SAB1_DIBLA|nr:unnamed protein product [Dibothriocephalus latus]